MTLNLQIENQIAILKINRPEALNALNSQVLSDLDQVLGELAGKFPQEVRGLILTGEGEKAFVAGADIKELSSLDEKQGQGFARRGQKIFRQIEQLPFPVIAAVNGFALGGGLELALACDFIYASEKAKLGLPEVNLGLIPGFGGTVRLSRVVGLNQARELIFSAQTLNAAEALALGLVNKVCVPSDLMKDCLAKMSQITAKAPLAVKAAKSSILGSHDQAVDPGLETEAGSFATLFNSRDTREGTTAFLEKRAAQFRGE